MKINPDAAVCIHAGPYSATVDPHGAALRALTYAEHPLLVDNPDPAAAAGAILAPWPNRTTAGQFTWAGENYQLEINEPARNTAIHGLLRERQWEVLDHSATHCTLGVTLDQRPWHVRWQARYTLHPDTGLDLQLRAHNLAEHSCPIGVGFHPYLTAWGAPVEECFFTAELVSAPFRREPMRGIVLDECFEVRLGARGKRGARLVNGAGNGVEITSEHPYFQIYTGGSGLAVEPQTCPPNMLRTGENLLALGADETATFGYGMRAIFSVRGQQG